jgi:hypothetical protein
MAAVSDPHLLDRDIRTQIAEHLEVWDHRPPDRTTELAVAVNRLRQAEHQHDGAVAYHHGCTDRRNDLGPLAVLRPQAGRTGTASTRTSPGPTPACSTPPTR